MLAPATDTESGAGGRPSIVPMPLLAEDVEGTRLGRTQGLCGLWTAEEP